jgi:hypothetical protein
MKSRLVLFPLLALLAPAAALAETGVRVTLPILGPAPGLDPSTHQALDDESNIYGPIPAACTIAGQPYCNFVVTEWARKNGWFNVQNFDYGGGNIIFNATHLTFANPVLLAIFGGTQLGFAHVTAIGSFPANSPVLQVSGYVSNIQASHVSAEVSFRWHSGNTPVHNFQLVIQELVGSTWKTIGSTAVTPCDVDANPSCGNQLIAVDGWADANSDVRTQLISPVGASGWIDIYEATLFGTECFPDVSSPNLACLQQ